MSAFSLALLPYLQPVLLPADKTFFIVFKLCGRDRRRPGDHPHHLLVFCAN